MRVVIVGFGSAGFAAAIQLKRNRFGGEIHVVDSKDYDLLHSCGLPYCISGRIKNPDDLMQNLDDMGLVRHRHAAAVRLVPGLLTIKDLGTCALTGLPFDACILATGSSPFIPPLPGLEPLLGTCAFTVTTLDQVKAIMRYGGRRALVLGGGAIGLETAMALHEEGYKVTILEGSPSVLSKSIDSDVAQVVADYLRHHGVRVLLSTRVTQVHAADGRLAGVQAGDAFLEGDLLIVAAGVRPNIGFVEGSGVVFDARGIVVNAHLQTSLKDVYAVGDIIKVPSLVDGQIVSCGLASTAYQQGLIAADNICGKARAYRGTSSTFVTKVGHLEVAATGFNSAKAQADGREILASEITLPTLPEWYRRSDEILVKVLIDATTRKIYGAQAVGKSGAAARINVVSAAIAAGMDIFALHDVELSYCPPVSDVYDPLSFATGNLVRRLSRPVLEVAA